ncbi:hypothetical protein CVV38_03875 [Candidatus Peregrinibacteria bacterium HGW-Peregrinibacteria-1]|jgi:heat shock protein HtpX|nr:MAG: hypothetical protein CVV38_03875 [Candidatus Peregrinibacteria bacterium HGW-Peregrinibacteria-1]
MTSNKFGIPLREQIRQNQLRSTYLLAIFPVIILMLTFLGTLLGFAFSESKQPLDETLRFMTTVGPFIILGTILWSIFGYYNGHRMILGFSGAKPIKKADNPALFRAVENAAIAAGLPKTPDIYIIPDNSLNAFATGTKPERSMVAISQGLLDRLEKSEMEAVMAHEVGHILNRDIKVMLISVAIIGAIQLVGQILLRSGYSSRSNSNSKGNILPLIGFLLLTVGVFISTLTRLAISREREYLADATSARITSNPRALASALRKIAADSRIEKLDGQSSISALCIADPSAQGQANNLNSIKHHLDTDKEAKTSLLSRLLASHPPIHDRIKKLERY